ncbi:MAG: DinB family protein [Propionibacteriaceae bacterium]|nr:DinB family protein [Propionibacteriaceae bacterium]
MQVAEVLTDAYTRIYKRIGRILKGLDEQALGTRIFPGANSISWLIWHLTRVQDNHFANAFDQEQIWTSQGWAERFGLPFSTDDFGYGHTSEQVDELSGLSAELLQGYNEAVWQQTVKLLEPVTADELDRIVDTSYTPPVTLEVRLVSVLDDNLQHVGQAAFIRGILERGAPRMD